MLIRFQNLSYNTHSIFIYERFARALEYLRELFYNFCQFLCLRKMQKLSLKGSKSCSLNIYLSFSFYRIVAVVESIGKGNRFEGIRFDET